MKNIVGKSKHHKPYRFGASIDLSQNFVSINDFIFFLIFKNFKFGMTFFQILIFFPKYTNFGLLLSIDLTEILSISNKNTKILWLPRK